MYTRSYYHEEDRINVPENYVGSAFGAESMDTGATNVQPSVAQTKFSPRDVPPCTEGEDEEEKAEQTESTGAFGSVLSHIPIANLLQGGIGNLFNLKGFKLGYEEILIIGIALLLLFSKEGDRECALILLALLFVN